MFALNKNLLIYNFPSNLIKPSQSDSIILEWTPIDETPLKDTILIYSDLKTGEQPLKIPVTGSAHFPTSINDAVLKNTIQNYPNPFTNSTNIKYSIPDNNCSLNIYTLKGEIIRTYIGLGSSGTISFDGSNLPGGVYLYKLISSDGKEITNKMAIVR